VHQDALITSCPAHLVPRQLMAGVMHPPLVGLPNCLRRVRHDHVSRTEFEGRTLSCICRICFFPFWPRDTKSLPKSLGESRAIDLLFPAPSSLEITGRF